MWMGGGGGDVELCCRPYSVSDQIQNLQNYYTTPQQNTIKDDP